jgi:hypothetical protein
MALVYREVKVVQENYHCDECEEGVMIDMDREFQIANQIGNTPAGTIYDHQCNNPECKHIIGLPERYPKILYRPIK